jgi:glucoamylase
VVWSFDNWGTSSTDEGKAVGWAGSFADIAVAAEQTGQLSFTLFWPEENRWEGRNFDIELHPAS